MNKQLSDGRWSYEVARDLHSTGKRHTSFDSCFDACEVKEALLELSISQSVLLGYTDDGETWLDLNPDKAEVIQLNSLRKNHL